MVRLFDTSVDARPGEPRHNIINLSAIGDEYVGTYCTIYVGFSMLYDFDAAKGSSFGALNIPHISFFRL